MSSRERSKRNASTADTDPLSLIDNLDILIELGRRGALNQAIDTILWSILEASPNASNRVRRNIVQKIVADALRILDSPDLRTVVNKRAHDMGFSSIIVEGKTYFKHCKLKVRPVGNTGTRERSGSA